MLSCFLFFVHVDLIKTTLYIYAVHACTCAHIYTCIYACYKDNNIKTFKVSQKLLTLRKNSFAIERDSEN